MKIKKFLHNFIGFSYYKNAYVLWDEDKDERIFEAIDLIESRGYPLFNVIFAESHGTVNIYCPEVIYYQAYQKLHEQMIDVSNDGWLVKIL